MNEFVAASRVSFTSPFATPTRPHTPYQRSSTPSARRVRFVQQEIHPHVRELLRLVWREGAATQAQLFLLLLAAAEHRRKHCEHLDAAAELNIPVGERSDGASGRAKALHCRLTSAREVAPVFCVECDLARSLCEKRSHKLFVDNLLLRLSRLARLQRRVQPRHIFAQRSNLLLLRSQ